MTVLTLQTLRQTKRNKTVTRPTDRDFWPLGLRSDDRRTLGTARRIIQCSYLTTELNINGERPIDMEGNSEYIG